MRYALHMAYVGDFYGRLDKDSALMKKERLAHSLLREVSEAYGEKCLIVSADSYNELMFENITDHGLPLSADMILELADMIRGSHIDLNSGE